MHNFRLIEGSKLRPKQPQEYFEENGVWYWNIFQPTHYMMLKGKPIREPTAILSLILHLANYDIYRYKYLLNWIALFFTYLIKSQVAVALIGNQGAGKGILFDMLSKLFGKDYCITINDESFNSKYKAKIIQHKLFYNFDEITFSTSKRNDSVIKALITNSTISLEEKNVTMEEEIELHGQCLFTSNHTHALHIEASDRRFTVFNTGDNLSKNNYLNYGSYSALKAAIDRDLEDFAKYLKNYDVDIALANTALDTPEKQIIINASKDVLKDFHRAIVDMDISYFDELSELNSSLYIDMQFDFRNGKVNRANITKAYNTLFSGKNMTSKELMAMLRELQPHDIFTSGNMSHSGNTHYYHLVGRK